MAARKHLRSPAPWPSERILLGDALAHQIAAPSARTPHRLAALEYLAEGIRFGLGAVLALPRCRQLATWFDGAPQTIHLVHARESMVRTRWNAHLLMMMM